MENTVDMVFTEAYIMAKRQFQLRGGITMDIPVGEPPRIQENYMAKAEKVTLADESDFPDLSNSLPDVSIHEQLRLTSVNRGKILSCQRDHQRQLLAIWHSQSSGNQVQDENQGVEP